MPPRKKMNGSELLAELGASSIDRVPPPAPIRAPAPSAATGRPPKVAGKGVPLTLRVSEDHAAALGRAALAKAQADNGRTTVTPQDIVRILIERAVADPAFPNNIIGKEPS